MFTTPAIAPDALLACLHDAFGLCVDAVTFLPLGADRDTALYRAEGRNGGRWFVRLRSWAWNPVAVTLPHALYALGVREVIPPRVARDGRLWADLGRYCVIVLPWVDARNAYDAPLTDAQWVALGDAVRRLHDAPLPQEVLEPIPAESYGNRHRERLRVILAGLLDLAPADDLAARTVRLLADHRDTIAALVARTDALAARLQAESQSAVVCHTDLHAGNVLTGSDGTLYLVDWDAPLRAPRERDLMYAGGGQFGNHRLPAEEEALFYRGYGDVAVDRGALAYYRYARIVEDLAIYADELLGTAAAAAAAGAEDRALAYHYLASNFEPGGTLEIARDADR